MKQAGTHDYEKPLFITDGCWGGMQTFSVGIFEWVPAKGGGVKRGKAKVRVVGSPDRHASVFAKADEIVAQLDAGTYSGRKRVIVGW